MAEVAAVRLDDRLVTVERGMEVGENQSVSLGCEPPGRDAVVPVVWEFGFAAHRTSAHARTGFGFAPTCPRVGKACQGARSGYCAVASLSAAGRGDRRAGCLALARDPGRLRLDDRAATGGPRHHLNGHAPPVRPFEAHRLSGCAPRRASASFRSSGSCRCPDTTNRARGSRRAFRPAGAASPSPTHDKSRSAWHQSFPVRRSRDGVHRYYLQHAPSSTHCLREIAHDEPVSEACCARATMAAVSPAWERHRES
jgi:hypothetical protein